jgi:hypothetical protein
MTHAQQARLIRNATLNTFMGTHEADFTTDVAMKNIAALLVTDSDTAVNSSIAAEADNSGYSAEKEVAKVLASNTAAQLCANSQVKLDILGNKIVSQSLHSAPTFYLQAPDALCGTRLLGAHDIMLTNLAIITPDYLTAPQLANFLTQITTFTGLTGTTNTVNGGETVLTKKFAADVKVTNKHVVTIKKVGLKYKTSNYGFYNELNNACKLPPIPVRHNDITMNVVDANTGLALSGVTGTLSKSNETPVSTIDGVITYTKVKSGAATGTIEKAGYITQMINIKIVQGKMNTFNYTLTPGVISAEQEQALKNKVAQVIADEKALLEAKNSAKKVKVITLAKGTQ